MAPTFNELLSAQLRGLRAVLLAEHQRKVSALRRRTHRLKKELQTVRQDVGKRVVLDGAVPDVLCDAVDSLRSLSCNRSHTSSSGSCTSGSNEAWELDDQLDPTSAALSIPPSVAKTVTASVRSNDETDGSPSSDMELHDVSVCRAGVANGGQARPGPITPFLEVLPHEVADTATNKTWLITKPSHADSRPSSSTSARSKKKPTPQIPRTSSPAKLPSEPTEKQARLSLRSTDSSGGDVFEVLPVWGQWKQSRRMMRRTADIGDDVVQAQLESLNNRRRSSNASNWSNNSMHNTLMHQWLYNGVLCRSVRHLMVQPSSRLHLLWESMALLLIVYDIGIIPMELFNLPPSPAFAVVSLFAAMFWTLDIPHSFLTGTIDGEGTVVMEPSQVARHYLSSWFPMDIVCVSVDWVTIALSRSTDHIGVLLSSRLLRAAKLLRLAKVSEINHFIGEHIWSEEWKLITDIARETMIMLLIAHIFACIWYGIGRHNGWVSAKSLQKAGFRDSYVWSFHWAVSLFIGESSMEPENVNERGFTIFTTALFFLLSSLFVSRITTALTRLQLIASKQSSDLSVLRRYLGNHGISASLSVRVQRNAQHALLAQKKYAPERDIELLALISEPLRAELHYETYAPVLMTHPFFDCYHILNSDGIRKLCHTAATQQAISAGDPVFINFEAPQHPRIYFVMSGKLEYKQENHTQEVSVGQWAAEASLWTFWIHCGTLKAHSECMLLVIDAKKFQDLVGLFPTQHAHCYATGFVQLLNSGNEQLTDLSLPGQEQLITASFPEFHGSHATPATGAEMMKRSQSMALKRSDTVTNLSQRFRRARSKTAALHRFGTTSLG